LWLKVIDLLYSGELENAHFVSALVVKETVTLNFFDKISFWKQSLRKTSLGSSTIIA
jgi:hypothetical protein